jgi:hypothetical protein
MKALAPLFIGLALLAGCAAPAPAPAPASSAGTRALPGVSDRIGSGQQCVAENQPCDAARPCCSGMSCTPNGRLGMLCRTPYPG